MNQFVKPYFFSLFLLLLNNHCNAPVPLLMCTIKIEITHYFTNLCHTLTEAYTTTLSVSAQTALGRRQLGPLTPTQRSWSILALSRSRSNEITSQCQMRYDSLWSCPLAPCQFPIGYVIIHGCQINTNV